MKFSPWIFAAAMSVSGLALAQNANSGITENNDPAKIAAIEQHAQQLASGAQTTPAMGGHDMQGNGMRHNKHHRPHKHAMRHHKAKDAKPASDKPMANESKG